MPIIPRYQPRGGPRVGGLDYAGAYSPPDGSDWRTLARGAALASDVSGAFKTGQAPAGDRAGAVKAGLSEIDRVRAEIEALNWRRGQLDADGQAVDTEQAELSRQAAGAGLSSGVRAAFDAMTAPRVEGYSALADSRRDEQRSRAAQAISQARQALGVEEFLKLADVAPSQARAALGSAAAAAGALARAAGADEAGVAEARRATLVAAQVRRIGETIGRDPARAAKILEDEGGVLPDAQRARLSREVELEQARVDANQAAAQMAGEHPDLVDDLDGFLAGMEATAGEGAHRVEAFRAAGMGAWRAARAAREAMESQAWAAVSPLLEPESGVHSWTQLPVDLWGALSPRQQRAVQARFASPWAESDGATIAAIRSLAVSDPDGFRGVDLMAYATELTPADIAELQMLQADARAGGFRWRAQQQAIAGDWERGEAMIRTAAFESSAMTPQFVRASYVPRAPHDPSMRVPPQGRLSLSERRLNAQLGKIPYPDGMFVDPDTGQVFKLEAQRSLSLFDGRSQPVLATDEEVKLFRRNRLGVDPSEADPPLKQQLLQEQLSTPGNRDWVPEPGDELLLARMIFAEGSNTPEDHEALGWSIINRVGHREHGDTLKAVLKDSMGFQIVAEGGGPSGGSPQWQLSATPEKMTPGDKASWDNAQRVAKGILSGRIDDPVSGGRFFYSSDTEFDGRAETVMQGWFRSAYKKGDIVPTEYKSRATGRKNYFWRDKVKDKD